jgi:microcystin-dependent protein
MEPFIGMIVQFGGTFAPRGWALCDGQLLDIASHSALFSILGASYGGDGRTTFALPDLRGRVAIHPGTGSGLTPRRIGEKSGAESVTLTVKNMPAHNHHYNAVNGDAKATTAAGNSLANNETTPIYSGGSPTAEMNPGVIGNTGNSQPFNIVQPFQCVNFIIALEGIFPSRN